MQLKDQVAIVTGAGRGIGRAIALLFAEHGARVTVADKDVAAAETVVAQFANPEAGLALEVDVSQRVAVEQMVRSTRDRWGQLDVLVCNAGIVRSTPLLQISDAEWEEVLHTNLTSVYLCCQAALRVMAPRRQGSMVTVASVAGKRGGGLFGTAHYAASKGGVIAFTRALAREAIALGIRVNGVCPGATDTELTAAMSPDQKSLALKNLPIQRFAQAEEIARAVLFLACAESSYCVGELINVDGGLMMD